MSSFPVLFVSTPFGPLRSPSLGLSLLQACCEERGIASRIHYLTLDFARRIGVELYLELTEGRLATPDLVGEWIFAEALNGTPGDVAGYLEAVLREGHWAHRKRPDNRLEDLEAFIARILDVRALGAAFLEEWAERLVAERPRVVGFTSVFQQNAASLALAARIKALDPGILTVLGGANAEGPMGEALFRHYPQLDWVVSGEAEGSFPLALEALLGGRGVPAFPGFTLRESLRDPAPAPPLAKPDLDALPYPDFRGYVDQIAATGLELRREVPFETSRGCWWGAKQHCTFCGLNGERMAFRSKSEGRALEEFRHLRAQNPGCEISVVDNILDMVYFKSFLPALAEEGNRAEIFFEVKANLTKDHLRLLKAAGVGRIQPGIESLSDDVLRLMRKGVKAIHCVQLLKWCAEVGIQPGWNLLAGFPGEDPADYRRMAELVPKLSHLPAPLGCGPIRLDRFSPNFREAAARGLVDVQAYPAYGFIYALPPQALDDLAYHFAFRYQDGREVVEYLAPLEAAVADWRRGQATLLALDRGSSLLVFDTRPGAATPMIEVEGVELEVLRLCDAATSVERLVTLGRARGLAEAVVSEALSRLQAKDLVLIEGGLALALPLGVGAPQPTPEAALA